jgi:phospholipase C
MQRIFGRRFSSKEDRNMSADIKHIFVLAMENRSFDHLFAYADIAGIDPPDASFGSNSNAKDPAALDPPHEFEDVQSQVTGEPPMSGFAQLPYANVSMAAFPSGSVPVLRMLARQYMLFDNWFSSMPGPTWPNRFFFHAATSGGLDNSPSTVTTIESETIDSLSFDFQNGTIYQQLAQAGKKWRVYHDDLFPQVLAIKQMIDPFRMKTEHFSCLKGNGVDCFNRDLNSNYNVDYTFIEPNYGLTQGGFPHGNCQHPLGSVTAGEAFIQYVYETIRTSAVWPNSLLIITYDEHGGFFDHVPPPLAAPPGDDARNHDRAEAPKNCTFDRLGVRVPAVAISPWIPQGSIGSNVFPGQQFDHTAIISTVREVFGLPAALTHRDAAVPSIASACSLSQMRSDTPAALSALQRLPVPGVTSPMPATTLGPPDHTTEAFARIAMSLDLAISRAENTPPVATLHPVFAPRVAAAIAPSVAGEPVVLPQTGAVDNRREQLTGYMRAVAERRRSGSTSAP